MKFTLFVAFIAVFIAASDCKPESFITAIGKCGTSIRQMLGFLSTGEFQSGNKCVFECIAKETEMVDSNFNFDENKLKKVAGNNRFVPGLKTLLSDAALKKCSSQPGQVSNCEKAYNFVKCVVDEKNKKQAAGRPRRRRCQDKEKKYKSEATTPKVTTPQVTTPEVTTSQVTTLKVTTTEVTTPKVTMPQVTTPKVATPEVTTPKIVTPEVTTPEVTTPKVTIPEVTTPKVATPEITTPEVTTPKITIPEVITPTVIIPEVTKLEVTTPTVIIPEVTTPEVATPKVN